MNKRDIWTNKDGLYVGFGPRGVESNVASAVPGGDLLRKVVLKIEGTKLQAAATGKELANAVYIPAGSNVKSVRVVVDTAFTGGTSLDLGGYTTADVADDENGFIIALLTATLVSGYDETYTAPAANKGGAYIGTQLATGVKVAPSYNTSVFTAGVATVTIEYETPAN
jgi:hypothetical protein